MVQGATAAWPRPRPRGCGAALRAAAVVLSAATSAAVAGHVDNAAPALPDAVVDLGTDAAAGAAYAIPVDSVRRQGDVVGYTLYVTAVVGGARDDIRILADCRRRLRGVALEPAAGVTAPKRIPVAPVAAGSREARELAAACALPEGPRSRWFAGFVVAADGTVIAPHERTYACRRIVAAIGSQRRAVRVVGSEEAFTILKIDGDGPFVPMPWSQAPPARGGLPVTLVGIGGVAVRVSAGFALPAGTNRDDTGWPQVETLSRNELGEGLAWNAQGEVVGLAVGTRFDIGGGRIYERMVPADYIRDRLAANHLPAGSGGALNAEAAMRRAIGATVVLACVTDTAR